IRCLLQYLVTSLMAPGIADRFEVIEINHNQAGWLSRSPDTLQLLFKNQRKMAVVIQSGQSISIDQL
ncbi:MAG: hypothetical protein V3U62_11145, partial [Sedimenticolaceae bacterium]